MTITGAVCELFLTTWKETLLRQMGDKYVRVGVIAFQNPKLVTHVIYQRWSNNYPMSHAMRNMKNCWQVLTSFSSTERHIWNQ